jgi:hypothetical protein
LKWRLELADSCLDDDKGVSVTASPFGTAEDCSAFFAPPKLPAAIDFLFPIILHVDLVNFKRLKIKC